jgi:hypothetical protein
LSMLIKIPGFWQVSGRPSLQELFGRSRGDLPYFDLSSLFPVNFTKMIEIS